MAMSRDLAGTSFTTAPSMRTVPDVIGSSPRSSGAPWTCHSPRAEQHHELAVRDRKVEVTDGGLAAAS